MHNKEMSLDSIVVFIKVVQFGSFTRAARALGMPNTTVSAKVAILEKRLGVTLLQRTTRKLHVTQAGETYFRRCLQALERIEMAEAEIASSQLEPFGVLRITAAVDVGHAILPELIQIYLKRYPKMKVDLLITNHVVDLIAEGVDLGIRAGKLEDSTLMSKRFIHEGMHLFASSDYVKKYGMPLNPKQLDEHQMIVFTPFIDHTIELSCPRKGQIHLLNYGLGATKKIENRVQADDLGTLKIFCLLGQGIAMLPSFLCKEELKQKKLIPVLPEWEWGLSYFSFVYPAQKFMSRKVQAFLECAESLRPKADSLLT